MYTVERDPSKRLVVISASGHVTAAEVEETLRQLRELLTDIPPGFRVLTDFRWLDRMDAEAARHIAGIMDAVAAKQVALVVRVMPDPRKDIGFNILSQIHYGPNIRVVTVASLAEAVQMLSEEPGD